MQKASFLTFCVIFLLYTHNEEERTADAVRSSFTYAGFINTLKRLAILFESRGNSLKRPFFVEKRIFRQTKARFRTPFKPSSLTFRGTRRI